MIIPDLRFPLVPSQFEAIGASPNLLILETVAIVLNFLVSARIIRFLWVFHKRAKIANGMVLMCAALATHTICRGLHFATLWTGKDNSALLLDLPLWVAFIALLWLPVYLSNAFELVALKRIGSPASFYLTRRIAVVAATLFSAGFILAFSTGVSAKTGRLFIFALLAISTMASLALYRLCRSGGLRGQATFVLCVVGGLTTISGLAILRFLTQASPLPVMFYRVAIDLGTTLLVLGSLFIFSNIRFADVLVKDILRIYWWGGILLSARFGVTFMRGWRWPYGSTGAAAQGLLAAAFLLLSMAALLKGQRVLDRLVSTFLFDEPDYEQLAANVQTNIQNSESEAAWFEAVTGAICTGMGFAAARIVGVNDLRNGANRFYAYGQGEIFPAANDPLRTVTDPATEVLLPIRVRGNVLSVLAVARDPFQGEMMRAELRFLRRLVRQLEARLETRRTAEVHRQREQLDERLRAQITEAELRALRAQIQPHFLFNSLNTIAHLSITAPEQAERMTTMLAEIFRYMLTSTEDRLIPLEREIRFLRDYLAIERMRFGERLETEFLIEPGTKPMLVPPLILQPLVENALRHGLGPKISGGLIRLTATSDAHALRLILEDTGVGLTKSAKRAASEGGIGLSNTRKRLECHYGASAALTLVDRPGGGVRASITLPHTVLDGCHS